jgi:hypothetical protein
MSAHVKLRNLSPLERNQLEKLANSRTAPTRLNERAHMLLVLHRGETIASAAKVLHITRCTVYR